MAASSGRSFAILPLLLAAACSACDGGASATTSTGGSGAGAAGPSSPVARDWTASPAVFTFTGATEIDALGDIHGDPTAMIHVLNAAGLIAAAPPYAWTGGSRILVVTGDVIDKGEKALEAIDILSRLESQAAAAGGRVVVTLGNHEAEFLAEPTSYKTSVFQVELKTRGLDPTAVAAGASSYGAWLRTRPVAALIDGWFFSHAGRAGGRTAAGIGAAFQSIYVKNAFSDPLLLGDKSLLEAEGWWADKSGATQVIDHDLIALPATHIVFGHEPGEISFSDDPAGKRNQGEIAVRYGGRLFMIDTGMSYAVAYSKGALLSIEPGPPVRVSAIDADGTKKLLWSEGE